VGLLIVRTGDPSQIQSASHKMFEMDELMAFVSFSSSVTNLQFSRRLKATYKQSYTVRLCCYSQPVTFVVSVNPDGFRRIRARGT
jgi:hypothetical protein